MSKSGLAGVMFIARQDMKSHGDSPPRAEGGRSTPSRLMQHKPAISGSLRIHYAIMHIFVSLNKGQYVVSCLDHEGNFFEVTL